MSFQYHTALQKGKPPNTERSIDRFEWGGSVALVYDLLGEHPLPAEFESCGCYYSEPPWPHGFTVFNARVGVQDQRTYADLVARLYTQVLLHGAQGKPTVMACSSVLAKLLPPGGMTTTFISGAESAACLYYFGISLPTLPDTHAVLRYLLSLYDCVGDYFCGNGTTATLATELGKKCVVSDYNSHCIGYLSTYIEAKVAQQ